VRGQESRDSPHSCHSQPKRTERGLLPTHGLLIFHFFEDGQRLGPSRALSCDYYEDGVGGAEGQNRTVDTSLFRAWSGCVTKRKHSHFSTPLGFGQPNGQPITTDGLPQPLGCLHDPLPFGMRI
jgi:hypothetical protein